MKKTVEQKKSTILSPVTPEPCVCRVHLSYEKEGSIPCVGHGLGCPCTEKMEAAKKEPGKK